MVEKLTIEPSDREMAAEFRKTMRCNCDLDNWEPERSTGHSHVCRIHKAVLAVRRGDMKMPSALKGGEA